MKKLFIIILAVFLMFGVASCTEETTTVTTESTVSTTTQTTAGTTGDPMPVLSGVEDRTIQQVELIDLYEGISAYDAQDGDLTSAIVIDAGDFDFLEAGVYTINVSVEDSDGNIDEDSFTVTVTAKEFTNQDWAIYDLYQIELDTPLVLPSYSANWTYFYWSSDTPTVITSEGYIIKPHVGSEPVEVTLTCRAVHGSGIAIREFVIVVDPNPESTVTSQVQVNFDGLSEEYVVADKTGIDIFYVNDGTVPYIDVETFINMVDGAMDSEIISVTPDGTDGLIVQYSVEYTDFDEVTIITETYQAYIDFTENTFTVNNFDFFGGYVSETESDYGSGLIYTGADYVAGEEVTIPLGDYNFDLVIYENGGETYYLMPFAVTNLLFLGGVYYDAYFNGDKIYGVDTFTLYGDDNATYDLIRTTSLNSLAMAEDLKLATYNFMALVIDYFYGLKEDKNIESGYEIMSAYAKSIITGTDLNLNRKIFDITYGLDDLHTSYGFPGYYESPYYLGTSVNDLGPRSYSFYEAIWAVQDLIEAKYGSLAAKPEYELLDGNTIAVIHMDEFTIDTPDWFADILDGLPSTVEDVVIDLSYNTGGNLGAVLRIYGYMTEESFSYHSQNPADNSAATYYIESEYVAYDFNWYVLTSGVTFSAANLFASIAKEMGIPVIGQDSSGGASSIGVFVTPDGTVLIMSTNNVLSTKINDEYESIEYGIEVDYFMSNVTSDSQLIAIIDEIKG